MKNKVSLIKKSASLIIFFAFYALSVATSHFPYLENAENPTLSFIMSALALLSFYLLAIAFCKSKKFLIIVSIFFALVTCCFTCLLFEIDDFLFSHIILNLLHRFLQVCHIQKILLSHQFYLLHFLFLLGIRFFRFLINSINTFAVTLASSKAL